MFGNEFSKRNGNGNPKSTEIDGIGNRKIFKLVSFKNFQILASFYCLKNMGFWKFGSKKWHFIKINEWFRRNSDLQIQEKSQILDGCEAKFLKNSYKMGAQCSTFCDKIPVFPWLFLRKRKRKSEKHGNARKLNSEHPWSSSWDLDLKKLIQAGCKNVSLLGKAIF